MPTVLDRLGKAVLDFVLPQSCLDCGRSGQILCRGCRERWRRVLPPYCQRCGLPSIDEKACPDCAKTDFAIDGIRSVFLFEGQARQAILKFKYENLRVLALPLAEALVNYIEGHDIPFDIVMPVPLHRRKLAERGYNQSALLAREMARWRGWTLAEHRLTRQQSTPAQATLASATARRQNVQYAFMAAPGSMHGHRVLLIDDIATTGSTLDACASALQKAGALSVWGLTVAREI